MNPLSTAQAQAGTEPAETESANRILADYYRCPLGPVQFRVKGQLERRRGYFRLGPDAVCYGRLSCGDTASSPLGDLPDALKSAEVESHGIQLSFDVGEAIDNLRRERYTAHFRDEGRLLNAIVRKAYYLVRPLLGVSVRQLIQRLYLKDWEKIPFPAWPVDATVDRIHKKLLALSLKAQNLEKVPFIWFWPERCLSCFIMTHDVEEEAGRNFCSKVMDLDESFGIRSTFQVVPENRYTVSKSFLDSITSRGFEVNVHDLKHDGRLYADRLEFLRRAERINEYVREYDVQGFRSGILYRNADWFDVFEFSYDMSLPNVAHLDPQRGGCCTVMPFFIGRIIELPVTCTQDYTLFRILNDYSLDLWKRQVDLIRQNHGLISFIVHPDYVIEQRARDTYKALLEFLASVRAKDRVWAALPRDVATWWRKRSEMRLVRENGEWRVEGPGSERACVAYASLAGNTVRYHLAGEREAAPSRS
jgi:hypothetical protein